MRTLSRRTSRGDVKLRVVAGLGGTTTKTHRFRRDGFDCCFSVVLHFLLLYFVDMDPSDLKQIK